MFVIPTKEDQVVIDPQRRDQIPAEGRDVGTDHPEYWFRREQDGDVKIVPPAQEDAARKNAADAEEKRNAAALKVADQKSDAPNPETPAPATSKAQK